MKPETKQLLEAAKRGVLMNVSTDNADLLPVLLMLNPIDDGVPIIGLGIEDKDALLAEIQNILDREQPDAYVLVMEAWATSFVEAAMAVDGRVRDMAPDDRYEAANIITVERGGRKPHISMAPITRLGNGSRKLGQWESSFGESMGRFIITDW